MSTRGASGSAVGAARAVGAVAGEAGLAEAVDALFDFSNRGWLVQLGSQALAQPLHLGGHLGRLGLVREGALGRLHLLFGTEALEGGHLGRARRRAQRTGTAEGGPARAGGLEAFHEPSR